MHYYATSAGREMRLAAIARFNERAIIAICTKLGATALGRDKWVQSLNEARHQPLVGLTALIIEVGGRNITVLATPPHYLCESARRRDLDAFVAKVRGAIGRRVVLAPSRSIRCRGERLLPTGAYPRKRRSARRWREPGDGARQPSFPALVARAAIVDRKPDAAAQTYDAEAAR